MVSQSTAIAYINLFKCYTNTFAPSSSSFSTTRTYTPHQTSQPVNEDTIKPRPPCTGISMPHYYGWLDLSAPTRPSYALICRQATGEKGMNIVEREGMYMTEENARLFGVLHTSSSTVTPEDLNVADTTGTEPQHTEQEGTSEELAAKLDQLKASATQQYSLRNYDAAAVLYSEAAQIQDKTISQMAPENADLLYEKPFNFMELPYELRHMLLSYICGFRTMRVFLNGNYYSPPTTVPLPAIAKVDDPKLSAEATLVSIKQATIEIHSGPGNAKFQQWLSSIDFSASGETSLQSGFDAVHSLSFPYFSRYPHRFLPAQALNNDIQLMTKCRNLRTITLSFVQVDILLKPIPQLRREYRLDSMLSMFQHGELQTIVLRGPYHAPHANIVLQALAAWLRWEYAVRANLHGDLTESRKMSAKALEVLIE